MARRWQVKATKTVSCKRVSSALEDNHARLIPLHHMRNDRLKNARERFIGDAIAKRTVYGVVFPASVADILTLRWSMGYLDVASSGKEFTAFMKRHCHNSVGRIKGLLNPIAMVHIDIDVKNSFVVFQKLEDGQNNVVDIAKPRCLLPFCVMQPASPVYGDVGVSMV